MGVAALLNDLPKSGKIALDTAPIIYLVEGEPRYVSLISEVVARRISPGLNQGITSAVSIAEVLVKPIRQNRQDLANKFRLLFSSSKNLVVVDITSAISERAAVIRAKYGTRIPDSLQIAAGIEHGATAFITNDKRLRKVSEIKTICLADYLP